MRLWLRENERRPNAQPVKTDDRTPVIVGSVVWALVLAALLVFHAYLADNGFGWWIWIAVVGLALGVIGIIYFTIKRR